MTDAPNTLELALLLLERLHVGGAWWLYTRPHGKGYESDWHSAGKHAAPRRSWLEQHVFFGVNPHADIPATNAKGEVRSREWVRGTADNVAAINALFVEIDAKDTIAESEWLPYYVEPDVSGMTKTQARGALQKAQTAAIDAALPRNLAEYKRRALAAIQAAQLRPSACWDSGGGFQAVWFLDNTVTLDDHNRADVAHVQKEWVRLIGGDPASSDLNRVLRLPGSVNRKAKYGPNGHAVVFLWCDLHRTYAYSTLAALVPAVEQAPSRAQRRVYVPAGLPATLGEFADVPKLPAHPAISDYNARTDLRTLLLEFAYTDAGSGRMNRPGGDTAGVQLHANNTASIYSSADPLWCGHRITPAHALCVFEYDGDVAAMLDALTGGNHSRFLARIDAMRLWARTTNFATYAPEHAAALRRTDGNNTKVIDACCDLWVEEGGWTTKPIGKDRLGARAGMTGNAAYATLRRVALFAVDVVFTDAGAVITCRKSLTEIDPSCTNHCMRGQSQSMDERNEYTPRKAHDAYQAGTSRHMKQVARELAATSGSTAREWLDEHTRRGLGENGLRIMDAIHRCGGMTAQELADETGKSIHTIRDGLSKCYAMGLVDFEQERIGKPKYWDLEPNAFANAESRTFEMRTHRMADSREERRLEQSQLYAEYEHRTAATPDDKQRAWRKLKYLTARRADTVMRLHPDWTTHDARTYAETLAYRQWIQKRAELSAAKREGSERTAKHNEAAQRIKLAAIVEENNAMVVDLAELRAMARQAA